MSSRLERILERLHPARLVREVEVPHDSARGAYPMRSSIVSSQNEFDAVLAEFMVFYFKKLLNLDVDSGFARDEAMRHLKNSIRYEEALYRGMSGVDGGMKSVLDEITESWKAEWMENHIFFVMKEHWDEFNYDQNIEILDEFAEGLKKFAPYAFNHMSKGLLYINGRQIIKQYILGLRRYKNLWTKF